MPNRPRLIRRNNPDYRYLFKEIIPRLVSESKSRSNTHTGNHTITHINLFEPPELAGPWLTNDYEGNLENIETLYKVETSDVY